MDVRHGNFIWNEFKERANTQKHGVDFTLATRVFTDPQLCLSTDEDHSLKEVRLFAIGKVNGRILTVRFTYREGRIRIFGAGFWRKGKEFYEKEWAG